MAKAHEIKVGACLLHGGNHSEPIVIRCDPNNMFLTYDPEQIEDDGYTLRSLQELVSNYDVVDQIPDGCDEDVARAPQKFQL